ncbi:MAG TPA: adenylate/guanylate cyclase domain-containing protein [Gaiellaceae bacterium]|nr:adenylate/guanylate cyclase domain-containing protein [Gaiellaceae bacterium]
MAVSRRTVTVLFADVADSTPLGERLDPESVRQVMSRFFEGMSTVLERHGGTVEKFIGDAVMAVFGIPDLHEDDALRAVRAATELRQSLSELNDELEPAFGVQIGMRVGVNTGEVVAGDGSGGQMLATGDAVNVAKRLEESARTGEILIGDATRRLVANAVVSEPREGLELKGKADLHTAWNVLAVIEGASAYARRLDAPLIGREAELALLRETYDTAVESRSCRLFTVVGPAGIGKSRLSTELCTSLRGDATILAGRCLAYGDGITFWPLIEAVGSLGSDDDLRTLLAHAEDGDLVATRVLGVMGANPGAPGSETFWALRRLFEELARDRPLVVLVEDIHWAEPTLLDLLEYLAGWTHDSPVLLLCLARPDLLDERPGWLTQTGGGVVLEPLTDEESHQLLDAVAQEWPLDAAARERITEAAEGNPLYLEQMAAMLAEGGPTDGIPPTIHALIAARLDRLPADERLVLEGAAVAGKDFVRLALRKLLAETDQSVVDATLLSLARKDLLRARPGREDAYRFRHVLIRDAAYAGSAKEQRARLHERFADYAANSSAGRAGEVDEIVGYHLEQAFLYRRQLGSLDEHAQSLARRAAELLGGAGRRALRRRDIPAAATLLERATSLAGPDDPLRRDLLLDLSRTQREAGRLSAAEETLREAAELADAAADRLLRCRLLLEQALLRAYMYPERGTEELTQAADSVIPAFQELGYDPGLALAWLLVAEAHWLRCQIAPMEEALDRAAAHGGNDEPERSEIGNARARASLAGPLPVPEALARCREIRERAPLDRDAEAVVLMVSALLEAMRGNFELARRLSRDSQAILRELGQTVSLAALQTWSGAIELLAGDGNEAERELRAAFETLEPMGEKANLATIAASLAAALHLQARDEEAESLTALSATLASDDDFTSQIAWRVVRARVLAEQGAAAESETLAREAIELAEQTDCLNLQGDAWLSLANASVAVGDVDSAERAADAARRLYVAKGNSVMAERAATVAVAGR